MNFKLLAINLLAASMIVAVAPFVGITQERGNAARTTAIERSGVTQDRVDAREEGTSEDEVRTPDDLSLLFQKVWRVTEAPSAPALGSIRVFLPNGTLLETSCGETYRISTWRVPDREIPDLLEVTEDGEVAHTAEILELTNTTLRLQQNLVRSNEIQELTLSAVEEEFVCPDLPR